MSVARVMGYDVAYFIQQVAHRLCNQGGEANIEPAEGEKSDERDVFGGAAG